MKLRTIYAPAHFGNFYELSNYHEMRELFHEWKAWGINGFSTWFNPSNAADPFGKDPLYRWAREQPLKAWQRKRALLLAAQDEGLELGLCVTPNAVYIDCHSDHSIPDNVSFRQYGRVRDLVAQHGKY
jgi:hypothetical protein